METYSIEFLFNGKMQRFVIKAWSDRSQSVIDVYKGEDLYFNLSPGKFVANNSEGYSFTPAGEKVDPELVKLIIAKVFSHDE